MILYLISDTTTWGINKIANRQGLITFAHQTYFIDKDINEITVGEAKEILRANLFRVKSLNIPTNKVFIFDMGAI